MLFRRSMLLNHRDFWFIPPLLCEPQDHPAKHESAASYTLEEAIHLCDQLWGLLKPFSKIVWYACRSLCAFRIEKLAWSALFNPQTTSFAPQSFIKIVLQKAAFKCFSKYGRLEVLEMFDMPWAPFLQHNLCYSVLSLVWHGGCSLIKWEHTPAHLKRLLWIKCGFNDENIFAQWFTQWNTIR